MQLPPWEIVRDEPPPDDLLLVVRGGRASLSDAHLERATTDTWEEYRFFGISVFGAPGDDLLVLSQRIPAIELWVDDHQEYEPGVVHARLRHARIPLDPRPGDFLVVGDDDAPAVLAEVLRCGPGGELELRLLPGQPQLRPEFLTRRQPSSV